MEAQLHKELGEIKGLLEGVYRLVQNQHEATNQRITDMHGEVTRRLDHNDQAVVKVREEISSARVSALEALNSAKAAHARLDDQKIRARNSALGTGAGAGAVIAGGIEIVKTILKAG